VEIQRLGPEDRDRVLAAATLFDGPAREDWTSRFLAEDGHHLLIASVDGIDVGFVSGVETSHPDKGTEMFLYELGVDEPYRRRGIGRALVAALAGLAADRGCYGMWVSTEADNEAALATYRSAGAGPPEPGVTLTWALGAGAGPAPAGGRP
jgi:ribosomal protein S18 acetylase RimI-like enzyme